MSWSSQQQSRLSMERSILEKYFRGKVNWIDPTSRGSTKVDVRMTTSNNKSYTLRVFVPADFANSCPALVVCSPARPLTLRDGRQIGSSTANHSWGTRDGLTQICHFEPGKWTSENTLYQVFMKGLLWLEAYEGHLATGKRISNYLVEMSWKTRIKLQPKSLKNTTREQINKDKGKFTNNWNVMYWFSKRTSYGLACKDC